MAPPSAKLYDLLGLVQTTRKDLAAAEAAFLKAAQLDVRFVDPQIRLAELYLVGAARAVLT